MAQKIKKGSLIITKCFGILWYYYHTVKLTLQNFLKKIVQTNKKSKINKATFTQTEFSSIRKKLLDY